MQMVDFNRYVQNQRMYGGTAGRKMGIVYEGKSWGWRWQQRDSLVM